MTKLWTTTEIAKVVGVSGDYIRRLVREHKIDAQKLGRTWVVPNRAAEKFIKNYRPRRKKNIGDISKKKNNQSNQINSV